MDESLAAVLRWYVDMGVDIAVDDTPHDRFAQYLKEKNTIPGHVVAENVEE